MRRLDQFAYAAQNMLKYEHPRSKVSHKLHIIRYHNDTSKWTFT